MPITPDYVIASLIVIFFAIGLHEYAHAKVADLSGDPTPRQQGRVTLNLTKHFDLFGTIMIVMTTLTGFGIGWGKAVQVNPAKMHNPRWDWFASVMAGPLCNFVQAMAYAVVFRVVAPFVPNISESGFLFQFLFLGVLINISLMLFNLIPFGPLDGHWLVGLLLPEPVRLKWFQFNRTVGTPALLLLVLVGQVSNFSLLGLVLERPAIFLLRFLLGR
ncbi:MAG: site-2 protease family protein [Armatimonadetes bacterium]|nr:site-2 protease family protein [Armatimonadota bacterium]MBS1711430.1 site-2 protease family protein [Armatimonadota bacterium]MBX3107645.1 site-2 protease family protein [Fimbriimonadaceae bacterium]